MVLVQNNTRKVTLEKVAFYTPQLMPHPQKYISDYPIISTATPNISAIRHNISTYRQISQNYQPALSYKEKAPGLPDAPSNLIQPSSPAKSD